MKKNKMMRAASALLVAVLLTTCVISGTYAKYTTSAFSNDSARVAKWGFDQTTINIEGLFADAYDETVDSNDDADVIAPGTTKSTTIWFTTETKVAPEVDYEFVVTATSNAAADNTILTNPNIKWAFYAENGTATWGTFAEMLEAIEDMSDERVEANNLPDLAGKYVVAWKWMFDKNTEGAADNDTNDTLMGNADDLAEIDLAISITATQLD